MEKENDNNSATTSAQNEKEKSTGDKKYNFYRKPSIKKKPPEVKQTLTSYKRMLKANPLLKYEMEGVNLSHLLSSSNKASGKLQSEKQSLPPTVNHGKPLLSNLQRSKSLKNAPNATSKPLVKGTNSIISGNKPKSTTSTKSIDISRQSSVDFNASTSRLLSSTKLEGTSTVLKKKETVTNGSRNVKLNGNARLNSNTKFSTNTKVNSKVSKTNPSTQDNCVSSSQNAVDSSRRSRENKTKPVRRSLSAQHFDRKKGVSQVDPQKCFNHVELTQSLIDMSNLRTATLQHDISPIVEHSRESSIVFKTPSAYERRSIARFTPRSATSFRRSLYHPSTPLPSLSDLQKRLNDWLTKRGKNVSTFHHLKRLGNQGSKKIDKPIDEENKENIEIDQDSDKGSYEDLKIPVTNINGRDDNAKSKNNELLVLNEDNAECIAKAALDDLQKLIQEGYPRPQCEGWLELIRQKYRRLEEEPQYWECRAAIEQSRGNISNAVQFYKTAIVQGAEIQAVDESLDILLQKFSLLNISTDKFENSQQPTVDRARILRDARNVFKSSIIQFAVQERKLKKTSKEEDQKKLLATPVRRSTRLSRSAYTSTPGVKICSSLQELDVSDRDVMEFKKNTALF